MFKNKVVMVTGATSPIGRATCIKFATEGATVLLVGRYVDTLLEVKKACYAQGSRETHMMFADICVDDEAKQVINETIERFNKIDVLVNTASIFRTGSIIDQSILVSYDEVMNTNLRAVVKLTSLAAPHLVKTKGNIVNVSSFAGERVLSAKYGIFSQSHAALNHFTKVAAIELNKHGVRVNAVSPGVKASGKQDHNILLSEWAEPTEVADLILFLASEDSKSIIGSNYVCDSGGLATQQTAVYDNDD